MPNFDSADRSNFVLIAPCFDDWESVSVILPLVDRALSDKGFSSRVLVVDDGSRTPHTLDFGEGSFKAITRVEVMTLRRNVGHQRAICIGLCHVASNHDLASTDGVVVMDADGEDAPHDVPRLIEAYESNRGTRAVFAKRIRRSEGLVFQTFYALYRVVHRTLTGIPVQIGNFSVLPMRYAQVLSVSSDLWNHYAAAVVQSRLVIDQIPTARAKRLRGRSKMNFVSLVSHGLSAMSVFADRIGVRALLASMVAILLLVGGIVGVFAIRLLTGLAIPGWATTAAGILSLLLLQVLLLAIVFAFLIHLGRAGSGFLPLRDYSWFVDRIDTVWSKSREL